MYFFIGILSCLLLNSPGISCYTVKHVFRGRHLWDKKKWPYKTGGILKEVQIMKFPMTEQEKVAL